MDMKIGFDGKRITQNFTGLGNYSRYILHILAEYFPKNQYSIFTNSEPKANFSFSNSASIRFHYSKNPFLKSIWRSFGIVKNLKNDKIDLYHGLSNEIPFGLKKANIASVVTIHDLIFYRYPQYYPWLDRKIYEYKVQYACKHADQIIAISEQTKRDLINFLDVDNSKIQVVYQNCNPQFNIHASVNEKDRIKNLYQLPDEYLLNVGTIETRKNALLIVKALKELDSFIHLVIIGKDTPYSQSIKDYVEANGLKNRVHFLKNVSFKDLPGIYQEAKIFIYPSEFEGFGIPIVEALSSGVPVIAATGSCLEEAGGPGSIYVDPKNSVELAKQIQFVLSNKEQREKMILAGYEHIKNFSNQKIAEKLIKLYQKISEC
jgi:glycosyltransferase involved in cell wall biosynthesis